MSTVIFISDDVPIMIGLIVVLVIALIVFVALSIWSCCCRKDKQVAVKVETKTVEVELPEVGSSGNTYDTAGTVQTGQDNDIYDSVE